MLRARHVSGPSNRWFLDHPSSSKELFIDTPWRVLVEVSHHFRDFHRSTSDVPGAAQSRDQFAVTSSPCGCLMDRRSPSNVKRFVEV